jgi:hypothetical protein
LRYHKLGHNRSITAHNRETHFEFDQHMTPIFDHTNRTANLFNTERGNNRKMTL